MKQNIIFFGSGDFVIPVIKKLLDHNLILVITNEKKENSNLIKFCKTNDIKWLSTNKPTVQLIKSKLSDVSSHKSVVENSVGILASFGAFVPDEVTNFFKHGIINIHPSLLPKYKGPSPVQYAVLNGENVTGVTLIKLDSELDHGPILLQKPYNLAGNETTEELLNILFEIGSEMVEEEILKLENGQALEEKVQNHNEETWSYRIEKKAGMINLEEIPEKHKLDQMMRAYYPWPTVWFRTTLKGQEKTIKLLPEGKIQVEGKTPMPYKDFINGFGDEGKEILTKLNLN